jgi:hypothetical protein
MVWCASPPQVIGQLLTSCQSYKLGGYLYGNDGNHRMLLSALSSSPALTNFFASRSEQTVQAMISHQVLVLPKDFQPVSNGALRFSNAGESTLTVQATSR